MKGLRITLCMVGVALMPLIPPVHGQPDTIVTTKILDNDPDNKKKVFAVVGEGYAAQDISQFEADVDRMVTNGVLGHDLFREYRSAFNVYRVNLISNQPGVSTLARPVDSALQLLYTGDWRRCWMQETVTSDMRLRRALANIPRYDYALIILKEEGFGGCQRGNRLFVTRGVQWDVVAHEYGHGVGNLFDEYWKDIDAHPPSMPVNDRNCSTLLDRNRVSWRELLDGGIIFPPSSDGNGSSVFPAVGMFKGCNLKSDGIYRPSNDCRMKSNAPDFCPVCRLYLKRELDPFIGNAASEGSGNQVLNKYLSLLIQVKQSGETQLLSATEIETTVTLPKETLSNYVLELTKNNETTNLILLSMDPFVSRSFADPKNDQGELAVRNETSTIIVNLPNTEMETIANDKLGLKIHELRSVFKLNSTDTPVVQFESLMKVKTSAKDTITISAKDLSTQLKWLPNKDQF